MKAKNIVGIALIAIIFALLFLVLSQESSKKVDVVEKVEEKVAKVEPKVEKSEEEKEAEKQAVAKSKRDADIAELSGQIPDLEKALELAEDSLKLITDKSARKEGAKMVREARKKLDEANDRLMKLQKGM